MSSGEELLIIGLAAFVLLPLPICLWLVWRRKSDRETQEFLESEFEEQRALLDEVRRRLVHLEKRSEIESSRPAIAKEAQLKTEESLQEGLSKQTTPETEEPTPLAESPPVPIPPPIRTFRRKEAIPSEPSAFEKALALLRQVGLWPPKEMAKAEAGLIQWWFPRIGGFLALLAAIFFAVYIAKDSSPIIRFIELSAVDLAVVAAGVWYWKRIPKLGEVLLATGLSMIYLTIVAGYIARPVKVIDNAVVGICLQFAVSIFIAGLAVSLKRSGFFIIALLFGFASSVFTAFEGFQIACLLTAIAYLGIAIYGAKAFGTTLLSRLGLLGAFVPSLTYLLLILNQSQRLILPDLTILWGFLAIVLSLYGAGRFLLKGITDETDRWDRFFLSLSTSIPLACGILFTQYLGGSFVWFYAFAAILFSAWAGIESRRGLSSFAFQLFFLKAAALTSLFFIYRLEGEWRWLALFADSLIVGSFLLKTRSRFKEAIFVVLTAAAILYAMDDNISGEVKSLFSVRWFLFFAFLIGLSLSIALYSHFFNKSKFRSFLRGILLLGLTVLTFGFMVRDMSLEGFIPQTLSLLILTLGVSLISPLFRVTSLGVYLFILIFLANAFLWSDVSFRDYSYVTLITLVFAYGSTQLAGASLRKSKVIEFVFHALWILSTIVLLFEKSESDSTFLILSALLACGATLASIKPWRTLNEASLILWFGILVNLPYSQGNSIPALISGSLFAAVLVINRLSLQKIELLSNRSESLTTRWHLDLLLFIGFSALLFADAFDWRGSLWAYLMTVVFLVGTSIYLRQKSLGIAALFGYSTLILILAISWLEKGAPELGPVVWKSDFLALAFAYGLLGIVVATLYTKPRFQIFDKTVHTKSCYFLTALSLLAYFLAFSYQGLPFSEYLTPIYAACGLSVIGLGIFLQLKPFRLVALASLLVPLIRLFTIDVKETLPRIIAFAILAALVMGTGYLYYRFQDRIEGNPDDDA